MYCGEISIEGEMRLRGELARRTTRRKHLCLYLYTGGGDPDAAFRMARSLKRAYKGGLFTVLIDGFCKSAGTLLALGADEIVMADDAELGPLDIQLMKPDEVGELASGLIAFQAIRTLRDLAFEDFESHFVDLRKNSGMQISTRTAGEIATKLVVGLLAPVYAQIDPIRLGEHARAMTIGAEYGRRLCQRFKNKEGLSWLISGYPSHSFVIERDEAARLLGHVRAPIVHEKVIIEELGKVPHNHGGDDENPRPHIGYVDEQKTDTTHGTPANARIARRTAARPTARRKRGARPADSEHPRGGSPPQQGPETPGADGAVRPPRTRRKAQADAAG
jgi:hypothetical protein